MAQVKIRNKTIEYNQREQFWKDVESGKWESCSFDVLDKCIKEGEIFLDIGAWNGVLSLYASKLGAECYAIEPDCRAFDELEENMLLNDENGNILISRIAISDKSGQATLTSQTKDGFGNSESSIISRDKQEAYEIVNTTTLEEFLDDAQIIPTEICLIKMDTEGAETLIIPQAKQLLELYKPSLYISFHPAWFENMLEDVFTLKEILFSIYKVYKATDLENEVNELQFVDCLINNVEHSFLFICK